MEKILKEHINKIVQISNEEFEDIVQFFDRKSYKKNAFISHAGTPFKHEFFILQGLVYSSYLNDKGKSHVLDFSMENQWVSDSHSFNTGSAGNLDFRCLDNTDMLCISFADKEKLCSISSKMEYYFRKVGIENTIQLQKRIMLSMSHKSKDRYNAFIGEYPKVEKRIPKVLMASYFRGYKKNT